MFEVAKPDFTRFYLKVVAGCIHTAGKIPQSSSLAPARLRGLAAAIHSSLTMQEHTAFYHLISIR